MAMDPRSQKHITNENYGPFLKGQYSEPGTVRKLLILTEKKSSELNMEFQNQQFSCQLLK